MREDFSPSLLPKARLYDVFRKVGHLRWEIYQLFTIWNIYCYNLPFSCVIYY